MPVGHIVIQHAGSLLATDCAPEQAGGVDAHAEDQRGRDEAWSGRGLWTDRRSKGQKEYQFDFRFPSYPHRQTDEVHFTESEKLL